LALALALAVIAERHEDTESKLIGLLSDFLPTFLYAS